MGKQTIAILVLTAAAVALALLYGVFSERADRELELLNEDIGQPRSERVLIQE